MASFHHPKAKRTTRHAKVDMLRWQEGFHLLAFPCRRMRQATQPTTNAAPPKVDPRSPCSPAAHAWPPCGLFLPPPHGEAWNVAAPSLGTPLLGTPLPRSRMMVLGRAAKVNGHGGLARKSYSRVAPHACLPSSVAGKPRTIVYLPHFGSSCWPALPAGPSHHPHPPCKSANSNRLNCASCCSCPCPLPRINFWPASLPVCPSIYLSICLSACLSVCLPVRSYGLDVSGDPCFLPISPPPTGAYTA